jgi:hypothetical protein
LFAIVFALETLMLILFHICAVDLIIYGWVSVTFGLHQYVGWIFIGTVYLVGIFVFFFLLWERCPSCFTLFDYPEEVRATTINYWTAWQSGHWEKQPDGERKWTKTTMEHCRVTWRCKYCGYEWTREELRSS